MKAAEKIIPNFVLWCVQHMMRSGPQPFCIRLKNALCSNMQYVTSMVVVNLVPHSIIEPATRANHYYKWRLLC